MLLNCLTIVSLLTATLFVPSDGARTQAFDA